MGEFETSKKRALDAFNECVEKPLLALLGAERVLSIEGDASGSTVSALLDNNGTSDLLINLDSQGILFMAANRISFVAPKWTGTAPTISMTLRNKIRTGCDGTELNKLHRMVSSFSLGVPVVLPRYLCMALVDERNGRATLSELIAVETVPLVRSIFDPADVNLPRLRMQFDDCLAASGKGWINTTEGNAPHVLLAPGRKAYAGIRANRSGDSSFFFFSRDFLDDRAIPYRYAKG